MIIIKIFLFASLILSTGWFILNAIFRLKNKKRNRKVRQEPIFTSQKTYF